jgi:hypothetical protein
MNKVLSLMNVLNVVTNGRMIDDYIFRFRNFQNHLHDMIDWFSPFDLSVHRVIINH